MAKAEKKRPKHEKKPEPAQQGITKLIVNNFKSLARPEPYEIEIRPLTILAGANSSGKSSAVQPLLLLKQTLEASFDPGPLLLDGPHAKFSLAEQILPRGHGSPTNAKLIIGAELDREAMFQSGFRLGAENNFDLEQTSYARSGNSMIQLDPNMSAEEIRQRVPRSIEKIREVVETAFDMKVILTIVRRRCFFQVGITAPGQKYELVKLSSPWFQEGQLERVVQSIVHVPGLRGNPERSYRTTAVGSTFPGTFENYVASVILHWQQREAQELRQLWSDLEYLGLTWKVVAKQLDAVNVEIQVGRLPHAQTGSSDDLVNIADVGFGVSQTLPVLVALLVAEPSQLVYIEQPEIHLHPKAQVAMAEILANAAKRGVRVVIETHSSLLLLAIQTLVAEGKLDPELAILHWFQRNKAGISEITSAELDKQGAYGDWPEDFGETELAIQSRYLDAAEEQILRAARG